MTAARGEDGAGLSCDWAGEDWAGEDWACEDWACAGWVAWGDACDGAAGRAGPDDPGAAGRAPPGLAGRGLAAAVAGSAPARGAPLASVAAIALAVFWSTSSSSDMRAVSAATRPETPSRMSVSRLIVSECLVDRRFRRRSAPSWMAVARAVASSSAFLACDFALASALSDFFLASVVVRSASVLAEVSVF